MNPNTLKIVLAIFLIAHGFVHISLTYVPISKPGEIRTPYWPSWWRANSDPEWLASKIGLPTNVVRGIGSVLWVISLVGFVLMGLGLFGFPGLNQVWSGVGIVSAVASILLHILFWHSWLIVGLLINLVVLAGLVLQFPKTLFS